MLSAGVAVLAGDLVGLAAAGRGLPPSLPLAVVAAAALGAALLAPRRLRRPPALLLLAACGAAGLSAGLAAGASAGRACTGTLATGDRVRASGRALHDVAPGGGDRSARLDLRDVELTAGGRRCRIPELVVRLRPPTGVAAGRRVRVRGEWWAWGRDGWPSPPVRAGFLRGRQGEDPGGGAGPVRPTPPETGFRDRLRAAASRRLSARLAPDAAPMAAALTLADRSGIPPELARRFADAGLAHLLAISGLHVGLVGGALLWMLARIGPVRTLRYGLAPALVTGYVVLIGVPPSAVRAGVLFVGWCAVRARGAPARTTELLGAAAAVGVMVDPLAPAGPGYQLSFAGFGGLVLGAALAERALSAARRRGAGPGRRGRKVALAAAGSAGAFLLTAPFAAAHFGRAAPVAVASNFAGVPLVTLSLAGVGATLALPGWAGAWAGDAATASLRLLAGTASWFATLPAGHGDVAPPGPVAWTAGGLAVAAATMVAAGARPLRALVPLAGAGAVALGGTGVLDLLAGDRALVCQLDVGQGDAAAVRTRRGRWIVLDGGPRDWRGDAGLRRLVPFLRDRGARSVSLVVLSHPHRDHLGGLSALLRSRPIGGWLDAGNPAASRPYAGVLDAAAEAGVRWLPARSGDRVRVDGIEVRVLAPPAHPDGRPRWAAGPVDANEASVAVRVSVPPGFVYLSTGDAGTAQEAGILDRWPAGELRADVLKAGHHGSRTSSSGRWLRAVRPRVAVVSAGAGNRYGHPHPEALRRLRRHAGRVWRTDRDGTFCAEVAPDGRWRIEGEDRWRSPRPDTSSPRPGTSSSGRRGAGSGGAAGRRGRRARSRWGPPEPGPGATRARPPPILGPAQENSAAERRDGTG